MSVNSKNRFHSDLEKCAYAVATLTDGVITYGTPIVIPDSISLTLSKKGNLIPLKTDGKEDVIGQDNQGYDGDLEILRLPESFETDCLGSTKNTDGTVDEFDNDGVKAFAFMYQFKGDKKAIRHCNYWCYASKPNVEGDNPDKLTPKSEKISIISRPRPTDGKIKTKTGDEITSEVYDDWFTAVPGETVPDETDPSET
jgi:phi13 family phage major tail protein